VSRKKRVKDVQGPQKAVFFLDRHGEAILPMPFSTWKVTIRFAEAVLTSFYDDNEVANHG
jgi:hypothetical protein